MTITTPVFCSKCKHSRSGFSKDSPCATCAAFGDYDAVGNYEPKVNPEVVELTAQRDALLEALEDLTGLAEALMRTPESEYDPDVHLTDARAAIALCTPSTDKLTP